MNCRTLTGCVSTRLSTLAMTCFLAGCSQTLTTLSGGTEPAEEADQAIATDVCRAWKPTPYSSRDTPETQTGNRANNAARVAYCPAEKQ